MTLPKSNADNVIPAQAHCDPGRNYFEFAVEMESHKTDLSFTLNAEKAQWIGSEPWRWELVQGMALVSGLPFEIRAATSLVLWIALRVSLLSKSTLSVKRVHW